MEDIKICREKTVCFTGHRVIAADVAEVLEDSLRKAIGIYIRRGYTCFITGGAIGFDSMAARCIATLKREHGNIQHILALPCRDQTANWKKLSDLSFYKEMLGSADLVVYTSQLYEEGCMQKRNRYMVDNSSVCISYVRSSRGGSAYTYKYAEKQGLEVVNLNCLTEQLTFC
ncbi:MAG: DUF1273 family protein [Clostridia bacterium]|nr:DUF1273 family protein [Clostridia bacterium]